MFRRSDQGSCRGRGRGDGWGACRSASARLPPGGIVEDVNVHAVLREQHVPHHRAPDEAVPHR